MPTARWSFARKRIRYFLSMTITPLSEGSFTIDQSKLFVPFDLEEDEIQQRPAGSLLVEIQPFLVRANNELILFDTGLGFGNSGESMQIYKNLAAENVMPGDINK